jgi:3-oxoacyl-[acyl-carrier protein] reductase
VAFTDIAYDDNMKALSKSSPALGVKAKGYASDASNFENSQQVVDEIAKEFGTIDILVNNAGITRDTLLMRMTEEQWDLVIRVNLKSVFYLTKAVQKYMLKQKNGSIINMSSVVGVSGNAGRLTMLHQRLVSLALQKLLPGNWGHEIFVPCYCSWFYNH